MNSTELKNYIKALPEQERVCLTYGVCSLPVTIFTEEMPANTVLEALVLANDELKSEPKTIQQ